MGTLWRGMSGAEIVFSNELKMGKFVQEFITQVPSVSSVTSVIPEVLKLRKVSESVLIGSIVFILKTPRCQESLMSTSKDKLEEYYSLIKASIPKMSCLSLFQVMKFLSVMKVNRREDFRKIVMEKNIPSTFQSVDFNILSTLYKEGSRTGIKFDQIINTINKKGSQLTEHELISMLSIEASENNISGINILPKMIEPLIENADSIEMKDISIAIRGCIKLAKNNPAFKECINKLCFKFDPTCLTVTQLIELQTTRNFVAYIPLNIQKDVNECIRRNISNSLKFFNVSKMLRSFATGQENISYLMEVVNEELNRLRCQNLFFCPEVLTQLSKKNTLTKQTAEFLMKEIINRPNFRVIYSQSLLLSKVLNVPQLDFKKDLLKKMNINESFKTVFCSGMLCMIAQIPEYKNLENNLLKSIPENELTLNTTQIIQYINLASKESTQLLANKLLSHLQRSQEVLTLNKKSSLLALVLHLSPYLNIDANMNVFKKLLQFPIQRLYAFKEVKSSAQAETLLVKHFNFENIERENNYLVYTRILEDIFRLSNKYQKYIYDYMAKESKFNSKSLPMLVGMYKGISYEDRAKLTPIIAQLIPQIEIEPSSIKLLYYLSKLPKASIFKMALAEKCKQMLPLISAKFSECTNDMHSLAGITDFMSKQRIFSEDDMESVSQKAYSMLSLTDPKSGSFFLLNCIVAKTLHGNSTISADTIRDNIINFNYEKGLEFYDRVSNLIPARMKEIVIERIVTKIRKDEKLFENIWRSFFKPIGTQDNVIISEVFLKKKPQLLQAFSRFDFSTIIKKKIRFDQYVEKFLPEMLKGTGNNYQLLQYMANFAPKGKAFDDAAAMMIKDPLLFNLEKLKLSEAIKFNILFIPQFKQHFINYYGNQLKELAKVNLDGFLIANMLGITLDKELVEKWNKDMKGVTICSESFILQNNFKIFAIEMIPMTINGISVMYHYPDGNKHKAIVLANKYSYDMEDKFIDNAYNSNIQLCKYNNIEYTVFNLNSFKSINFEEKFKLFEKLNLKPVMPQNKSNLPRSRKPQANSAQPDTQQGPISTHSTPAIKDANPAMDNEYFAVDDDLDEYIN